jgi:hypothetical protein
MNFVLAQGTNVLFDEHFWKWLIDQGILAVLICVVLFFYRRDYNTVLKNLTGNIEVLLQVLRDNSSSNDKLKNATDELVRTINDANRSGIQRKRSRTD